jgi:cobaltochelatase CobN
VVLASLRALLDAGDAPLPQPQPLADPQPHDWRDDPGPTVGVILYRALLQAGDLALAEALLSALRAAGLAPRALWVSGLRSPAVQRGVADLLALEGVQAVLCTTSFASVQLEEAGLGAPLWEQLAVPVFQLLCSTQSRASWQLSSLGLAPLDLSLQIALPELDGRITTRVGAFKEVSGADARLATALQRYAPDAERLGWVAQLLANWCELRQTAPPQRRLALVLAAAGPLHPPRARVAQGWRCADSAVAAGAQQ